MSFRFHLAAFTCVAVETRTSLATHRHREPLTSLPFHEENPSSCTNDIRSRSFATMTFSFLGPRMGVYNTLTTNISGFSFLDLHCYKVSYGRDLRASGSKSVVVWPPKEKVMETS
jgi:hypothetical protein